MRLPQRSAGKWKETLRVALQSQKGIINHRFWLRAVAVQKQQATWTPHKGIMSGKQPSCHGRACTFPAGTAHGGEKMQRSLQGHASSSTLLLPASLSCINTFPTSGRNRQSTPHAHQLKKHPEQTQSQQNCHACIC